MLLGRELHHNKEGKGLKIGESGADAKSLQLGSPNTDGTQTQTHTYLHLFIYA